MRLFGIASGRRLTIRKKLAFLFLGFALIPSSVVGVVSYLYARGLSEQYALNVESIAMEALDLIHRLYPIAEGQITALSQKSEFYDLSGAVPGREQVSVSIILAEAVKNNPAISLLLATDVDRVILACQAPGSKLIGTRLPESSSYKSALQGRVSRGGFEISTLTDKPFPGFWIHAPLYSSWDKATPIGVLSGFFPCSLMIRIIQDMAIDGKPQDPSRYLVLLRDDGMLVASPPFVVDPSPPLSRNLFNESPLFSPLRRGADPRGTLRSFQDRWSTKDVGYAGSQKAGAMVLALVDESVVHRQIGTFRTFLMTFTLLVVTISALTAWPMSRSITNPIQLAVGAAQRIASGDLTTPFEVTSHDEMGKLLAAMQTMTRDLSSLVGRVKEAALQLVSTISDIGDTARKQEAAVNGFGESTNEIAAATRQISATSQELVRTMGDVTQVAHQTATLADSGRSELLRMEATMKHLSGASRSISSRLAIINEKANNINSVITVIAHIADQTNLLSLNAAIEAEKAGEFGHGFSVVAREIRRLADQTAEATLDVEEMVKEMQSAVSSGVMEMDKFSQAVRQGVQDTGRISGQLSQIMERVQALTPRFATVNEGMQSQSQGAQQISRAMLQLSDAARLTSLSLNAFNTAANDLGMAVQSLEAEIARFKVVGEDVRASGFQPQRMGRAEKHEEDE